MVCQADVLIIHENPGCYCFPFFPVCQNKKQLFMAFMWLFKALAEI